MNPFLKMDRLCLEAESSWDTMAPVWMLDMMERGERIVVVAHEPPRAVVLRRSRATWTWIRNNFLRLIV